MVHVSFVQGLIFLVGNCFFLFDFSPFSKKRCPCLLWEALLISRPLRGALCYCLEAAVWPLWLSRPQLSASSFFAPVSGIQS